MGVHRLLGQLDVPKALSRAFLSQLSALSGNGTQMYVAQQKFPHRADAQPHTAEVIQYAFSRIVEPAICVESISRCFEMLQSKNAQSFQRVADKMCALLCYQLGGYPVWYSPVLVEGRYCMCGTHHDHNEVVALAFLAAFQVYQWRQPEMSAGVGRFSGVDHVSIFLRYECICRNCRLLYTFCLHCELSVLRVACHSTDLFFWLSSQSGVAIRKQY